MKRVIAIILAFMFSTQMTQANLLVSPTRLAFEGKERVKDLILINVSDKARSYRIEWEENTTDDEGRYTLIAEGNSSFSASQFIRFSPRQVMLQPGERQSVKLMLRRKSNMNLAEYRSHLKVTALPPKESMKKNDTVDDEQGIKFKIDVLTSYTLPVIIRTQPVDANIQIDSVSIKVDQNNLASFDIDLRKQGTTSVTGEINIYFLDKNLTETRVGVLRGVNIFHEKNRRLTNIKWQDYAGPVSGNLRIEYIGGDEFVGKQLATYQTRITQNDFN